MMNLQMKNGSMDPLNFEIGQASAALSRIGNLGEITTVEIGKILLFRLVKPLLFRLVYLLLFRLV